MKYKVHLLVLSFLALLLVSCSSEVSDSELDIKTSTLLKTAPLSGYDNEVSFSMIANDINISFNDFEEYIYYIEDNDSIIEPEIYYDLYEICLNDYVEIQYSNNIDFKLITDGKYKKIKQAKIYSLSLNNDKYEKNEASVDIKADNNNLMFALKNNEEINGFYIEIGIAYVNNDSTGSLYNLGVVIMFE